MSGLLIIEDSISRSLFPSDCSPQNKVPSDSFNVNKAIHISLAAQPWHQQRLSFTNIKHSCRVIEPHFMLSWTVHDAQLCLFITKCTFTMATQLTLDWNIHEAERAHNKHPETAFAWARTFNDACLFFFPSRSRCFLCSYFTGSPAGVLNERKPRDSTDDCFNGDFLPSKTFHVILIPSSTNQRSNFFFFAMSAKVEGLYADLLPWHVNLSLPKCTGAKVQSSKCIWLLLKPQNTQLWISEINEI